MLSTEKVIKDLKKRIADNDETVNNQIGILGETVASFAAEVLNGTPFTDQVAQIKAAQEELNEKKRTVKEWEEVDRQLDELKKDHKVLEADIASLKKEMEPSFEEIGSAALSEYSGNRLKSSEAETVLSDLVSLDENIKGREREILRLETGEKRDSFFGKTFAKGKGLVLKGAVATQGLQKSRLLRDVGEKIAEIEMPKLTDGSPLLIAMGAIRPLLNDLKKARAQVSSLEKKRSGLAERKIDIEKKVGMRNPLSNLRHEIERLEAHEGELYENLGNLYLNTKDPGTAKNERTAKSIEAIATLKKEIEKTTKLIVRNQAAAEVERLDSMMQQKKLRAANLEKELQEIAAEVDRLKGMREQQLQVRGNLKTLELDESGETENKKE